MLQTTWNFGGILRSPLQSWGFFVFGCSQRFQRRLRRGWQIFLPFLRELGWVLSDILRDLRLCRWVWCFRGSTIYSRRRFFGLLTARLAALLAGSWSQMSPGFSGFSEVLCRTDSRLRATSLEFFFLPSIFLVSRQRRFRQVSSLLSNGIFSVPSFLHVLWGAEEEIEIIEELLAVFFELFITNLPCHVVTLQGAVCV